MLGRGRGDTGDHCIAIDAGTRRNTPSRPSDARRRTRRIEPLAALRYETSNNPAGSCELGRWRRSRQRARQHDAGERELLGRDVAALRAAPERARQNRTHSVRACDRSRCVRPDSADARSGLSGRGAPVSPARARTGSAASSCLSLQHVREPDECRRHARGRDRAQSSCHQRALVKHSPVVVAQW